MSFVATAIVGGASIATGTIISANAASDAADAQGKIAVAQEAQAKKAIDFAAPTAGELETLGNQISLYKNASSQAQAQLSTLSNQITQTYGSNIIELGQQLHDQLTGKDSGVVATATSSISRERAKLEQSLIDKLGPGGLTSSAGIQALNNFDIQSNQYLTNLRQDAVGKIISNLSGLQGGQSNSVSSLNSINSNLSGILGQIQNTQGGFQTRQANATIQTIGTAGSENVQALQEAKGRVNTGNQIAGLGGNVAGYGIGQLSRSPITTETPMTDVGFQAPTLGQSSGFGSNPSGGFKASDLSAGLANNNLKIGETG